MRKSQLIAGELTDLSRGVNVDMSSEAVARRLENLDELSEFAQQLATATALVHGFQPSYNKASKSDLKSTAHPFYSGAQ